MSVATEAVAFLGADSLIMTGAAVYLGRQLVSRVAAVKQPTGGRNGTSTAGQSAPVTETAVKPPLAPVEEAPEAGAA